MTIFQNTPDCISAQIHGISKKFPGEHAAWPHCPQTPKKCTKLSTLIVPTKRTVLHLAVKFLQALTSKPVKHTLAFDLLDNMHDNTSCFCINGRICDDRHLGKRMYPTSPFGAAKHKTAQSAKWKI